MFPLFAKKESRVIDTAPDEVLARWAYSELISDNYAHFQGIEQLLEQARRQVRFTDLAPAEHDLLVRAWKQVRGPPLQPFLDGIEAFRLARWGPAELAQVLVLRQFVADVLSPSLGVPMTFETWIRAEPIKPLHQLHARFAIYDPTPRSDEAEPLAVGLTPGPQRQQLLVDGYHRAVRFWYRRIKDPAATLPVFVPRANEIVKT
jgi:hypothetical protein